MNDSNPISVQDQFPDQVFLPVDRPPIEGRPVFLFNAACGFPSPAEDYVENVLDLHKLLVRNQHATYFVRAAGESMRDLGILDGDLLVVDRSVDPVSGSVVVAAVDGELTVKQFERRRNRAFLVPANPEFPEIEVTGREDVTLWGVVTHAVHSLSRKG